MEDDTSKAVKDFYGSLLIMGGSKLCNFVAINLEGPSMNAVYKWRKLKLIKFNPGLEMENFKQMSILMRDVLAKYKIPKVPWLAAEDETLVERIVTYHQETDELVGFCGLKSDDPKQHKCFFDVKIVLGDDDNSYERLTNAFKSNKIGSFARVILLNPMHKALPRLVACMIPTCNQFNHFDVDRQWKQVSMNFKNSLEDVVGPLVGHSSDGDSRRRKVMVQLMLSDDGDRFSPIPEAEGFVFPARKEPAHSGYVLRDIGDQDPIHLVSRVLQIGPRYSVLMNHIEMVTQKFQC